MTITQGTQIARLARPTHSPDRCYQGVITVTEGQTFKVETSPDGEEFVLLTVPDGETYLVSVRVEYVLA